MLSHENVVFNGNVEYIPTNEYILPHKVFFVLSQTVKSWKELLKLTDRQQPCLWLYHWLIILTIYVAWMTSRIQVSSVIRRNISSLIRSLFRFSSQIRWDNSCSGWTMKSFALLSLLIILVVTGFPSNQKCRTLRFLQRDSSCGKTKYVKGFYREQGANNMTALLRDARCCSALPPDENNEQNCTFIWLRNELNKYVNHLIIYFYLDWKRYIFN